VLKSSPYNHCKLRYWLTEVSTPNVMTNDRPIIIINTLLWIRSIYLEQGATGIKLSCTTCFGLEQNNWNLVTCTTFGHRVHLFRGFSGGRIANNSGGALVKRGPAYTELALFARIDGRQIAISKPLGIGLRWRAEQILNILMQGNFAPKISVKYQPFASDQDIRHVSSYRWKVRSSSFLMLTSRRLFEAG